MTRNEAQRSERLATAADFAIAPRGRHARIVSHPVPLRVQLADPSLSLCPDGRSCQLYRGSAPRHAVSLHTI